MRSGTPPHAPRTPTKPTAASLVQTMPYIFIAERYIPVLDTTVSLLKMRLNGYNWKKVMADSTGYYIIFDDSRWGELAAEKCYRECHKTALFVYVMNMEYGNMSPSPEEQEKEQRAKGVDAVREATNVARQGVDDPDPDRHVAKGRKSGLLPMNRAAGIQLSDMSRAVSDARALNDPSLPKSLPYTLNCKLRDGRIPEFTPSSEEFTDFERFIKTVIDASKTEMGNPVY